MAQVSTALPAALYPCWSRRSFRAEPHSRGVDHYFADHGLSVVRELERYLNKGYEAQRRGLELWVGVVGEDKDPPPLALDLERRVLEEERPDHEVVLQ